MSLKSLPVGVVRDAEKEHHKHNHNHHNQMQIVSLSPFKLPDDWLVEERPRPSNPSHIDRYYYEPGTGRKFRSLVSVQRYLMQNYLTTHRMISENEDTTDSEPGTRQRFRSLRVVGRYLTGEDACTATPKKTHAPRKKVNLGKNERGPIHNLTSPPEKVSWVLSGPGGFWSPSMDDSMVSETEKLKWSEAFVLSIHDGVIDGLNS